MVRHKETRIKIKIRLVKLEYFKINFKISEMLKIDCQYKIGLKVLIVTCKYNV